MGYLEKVAGEMAESILKKIDGDAIIPLHKILTACGKSMYEKFGLEHWHPYMGIEAFKKFIEEKELYGIYQNGIAVATFNLSIKSRDYYYDELWLSPDEQASYLGQLAIDPIFQGKGLGKWCMHQVENIAANKGSKAIRFDALSSHPWLKIFYEKLGYLPRGIVKPKQWDLLCFEKILK